jgi:hypothetical protein
MLGHVARIARPLPGSRDEDGAFDRIANLNQCPDDLSSARRFSARLSLEEGRRPG